MKLSIYVDALASHKKIEGQVEQLRHRLGEEDALELTHPGFKDTPTWLHRCLHRQLLKRLSSGDEQTLAAPIPRLYGPFTEELHQVEREGTSIVIVTYNSIKTLKACLESVFATVTEHDEVIAVDNGSTDNTGVFLMHELGAWGKAEPDKQQYRLVLAKANVGYSRACNLGLLCATGRTVCFLNPDTVVWPGWLDGLRSRLQDKSVGAVGPVTDNVAGDQFIVGHLEGELPSIEQALATLRKLHKGESVETKLLVGFCLMLRNDTVREVGMIDEELVLGSDDLELSLRLRSHGLRLLVARDVFVHHEGGASFATVSKSDVAAKLEESTTVMRRKLREVFAPDLEPLSEDIWGIGLLPQQ